MNKSDLKILEKVFAREIEDGFYLADGGELSYAWDVIEWYALPDQALKELEEALK